MSRRSVPRRNPRCGHMDCRKVRPFVAHAWRVVVGAIDNRDVFERRAAQLDVTFEDPFCETDYRIALVLLLSARDLGAVRWREPAEVEEGIATLTDHCVNRLEREMDR